MGYLISESMRVDLLSGCFLKVLEVVFSKKAGFLSRNQLLFLKFCDLI
jgi:hypothetical protein